MDSLSMAVASGLRARFEAMDMLANNIANSSTAGFKKDGEFYGIFQQVEGAGSPDDSLQPVIQKNWTDLSQGTLQTTGNSMDFALSGKGWLGVSGPNGTLYSRNGSLRVNAAGTVTSQEGHPVRLTGGQPLQIQSGVPLVLGADGNLTQGGLSLGKLEILDFPEGSLVRAGSAYFRALDPLERGIEVPETDLLQGKLESANVSAPESAVRLINLTRQFEGLQRALQLGSEMSRKAIEEVAKV
ncbi:MAG: flagellar hook basal-body protein [Bryobacteraceae bacterium]|nr:flagellar hook basal-body protein [Bryobacteraceae bacterium]